jgi:hypothetical protein
VLHVTPNNIQKCAKEDNRLSQHSTSFPIKDRLLVVTRQDGDKTLLLVGSIGVHGCPGSRVLRMWRVQSFRVTGMTLLAVIEFKFTTTLSRLQRKDLSLTFDSRSILSDMSVNHGALTRCRLSDKTHGALYCISNIRKLQTK